MDLCSLLQKSYYIELQMVVSKSYKLKIQGLVFLLARLLLQTGMEGVVANSPHPSVRQDN